MTPTNGNRGSNGRRGAPPIPETSKILSHPIRAQILRVVGDDTLSPKEIAEAIGAPLSNTSYHVRQLAQAGALRLVRKGQRRGAVQHYYEVTPGTVAGNLDADMLTAAAQTLAGVTPEKWRKLTVSERRRYRATASGVVTSYLVGKPDPERATVGA